MIDLSWTQFKNFVTDKNLQPQYVEDNLLYKLFAFDGPMSVTCLLNKDESSDTVDFETNMMPSANQRLEPQKDTDGAQIINPKLATSGRVYQSMFCTLTTSKYGGVIAKNPDNTSNGQFVYKIYDVNGDEITSGTNENDAVLTTLEWQPATGYDIQGFCVYQQSQPTTDIYLNAVMAHSVPAEYGGSKIAIRGCNLKYANYGNRETDWVGDSASVIAYDGTYYSHWNILKIYHNTGVQHNIMVEVVWYV